MYQANVYKIMIGVSSDIQEKIRIACQMINRWNDINSESKQCILLPFHWFCIELRVNYNALLERVKRQGRTSG